jgi:hypothetical protein
MERIILPAVAAMECCGRSFKCALRGLMLLEFNARFGDPEAQVLIMRLMSDLLPALIAARERVFEIGRSALACRACGLRRDGGQGLFRRTPAWHRDQRSHSRIGGMSGFFMVICVGRA